VAPLAHKPVCAAIALPIEAALRRESASGYEWHGDD
jgi:hypothetical protein